MSSSNAEMLAATYSIVAFDRDARELGVAVQSKFPAVGALVPWAEAETGAIATQAWMNVAYGPQGLALLRDGVSAQETLDMLIAGDPDRNQRQVGIVDRMGQTATFTGDACLPWAGSRTGDGYAAQGNLLVSSDTLDALTNAFEAASEDPLPGRLVAALQAAQATGGDRRGQQAAALTVVGRGRGYGGCDIALDLRVDDCPEPVRELARLYELHQLHFGSTPETEWVAVQPDLRSELQAALAALGYASGDFKKDLETWAGTENFEERVNGVERLDPVIIEQLRSRGS
jgi:uncharacterized Ntn-hydrolase superfamily protein